MQFFILKIKVFFTSCKILQFLIIKTLYPDPDPYRPKVLDPDPDPHRHTMLFNSTEFTATRYCRYCVLRYKKKYGTWFCKMGETLKIHHPHV
jgi:hypothetical protein